MEIMPNPDSSLQRSRLLALALEYLSNQKISEGLTKQNEELERRFEEVNKNHKRLVSEIQKEVLKITDPSVKSGPFKAHVAVKFFSGREEWVALFASTHGIPTFCKVMS